MEKDVLTYHILVIGGSAGSLEVLLQLLPRLDPETTLAIIIIVHRKNFQDSTLVDLLTSRTTLPVKEIEDKDPLRQGHIYIAPGDYHVLFERDHSLALDASEKVNFSRPSIDVSFESAADTYGAAVTGLLLSGASADGVEGLKTIKAVGGKTLVQKPETASSPYMPTQAIRHAPVDAVVDVDGMAAILNGKSG
jgi:two-component system chemotaxis response regulator CheB